MIKTIRDYRSFVLQAAIGDFRHRYAGSLLGIFWNVLSPLAMLVVYGFVFTHVLSPRLAGVEASFFPLYLSAGFLPWSAFVESVTRGATALLANATHLKRTPIPEQVFVAQCSVSSAFGMLVAVALVVGFALLLGRPPSWTWLLLPAVVVLWQAFAFGLSLGFAVLNVFYRDTGPVLTVLMQIWMWSLPVVYLADVLPSTYQSLLPINPGYAYLTALRELLVFATLPSLSTWLLMLVWAAAAAALGNTMLRRFRSDVRDLL